MFKKEDYPVSHRKTKIGMLATIGVLAVGLVGLTIALPPQLAPYKGEFNATVYPASIQAIADSCGDIYTFQPTTDQSKILTPEAYAQSGSSDESYIPSHPMRVPVYGYLAERSIPMNRMGFYEETTDKPFSKELLLRTQFDEGTTVIYYGKNVDLGSLSLLKQYAEETPNVIVLPWEYKSEIPMNRAIAFSTWGVSQTCVNFSNSVADRFIEFAKDHPTSKPQELETVELDSNGQIPEID